MARQQGARRPASFVRMRHRKGGAACREALGVVSNKKGTL